MAAVTLNNPEWKKRCTAIKRGGGRCTKWSIRGGTTCPVHGGSAPQVRQAAEARLMEARDKILGLVPRAVEVLAELMESPDPRIQLRAAEMVLDRTLARKLETEVSDDTERNLDRDIAEALGTLSPEELAAATSDIS